MILVHADLERSIKIAAAEELKYYKVLRDVIIMIVKLDQCLLDVKMLEEKMKEIRDSL